jgi:hypothetical protein
MANVQNAIRMVGRLIRAIPATTNHRLNSNIKMSAISVTNAPIVTLTDEEINQQPYGFTRFDQTRNQKTPDAGGRRGSARPLQVRPMWDLFLQLPDWDRRAPLRLEG